MTLVVIGLGSNLDDPPAQLDRAVHTLREDPDFRDLRCSAYLCSPPLGGARQPDYCNAVVMAHCRLRPQPLLARLQAIETAAGRVRYADDVWASRPLDLDILMYGNETIATPVLCVPHPGIADRAFVVQAWRMLDPHAELPDGTRLASLPSAGPPLLPLWQPVLGERSNSRIIERSPSY